jgi:hypothetical protein
MRLRMCDRCQKEIKGKFIKCCESEYTNQKQKLNHVGDLCFKCWNKIKEKNKNE